MKVRLFSDVHLEFGDFDPGFGDVLVLAGDVCDARGLRRYSRFFDRCVEVYNKVFYTLGNHEYYQGDYQTAEKNLREMLPPGITLLNRGVEEYRGWYFVGATLWADFDRAKAFTMLRAEDCMSDYHTVRNGNNRLMPNDTLAEHRETMEWLRTGLKHIEDKPVFMFTHHAPAP